jgi:sec-independent protein translocase protein TatB
MGTLGGGEILVILLVALIVLGPQRLPDAAKSVGKAMAELRRMTTGFQNEIRSAVDDVTASDHDTTLEAQRRLTGREDRSPDTDPTSTAIDDVSRQATPRSRPRRTTPLRADPDPGAGDAEERDGP